jgi:hypothetical protein
MGNGVLPAPCQALFRANYSGRPGAGFWPVSCPVSVVPQACSWWLRQASGLIGFTSDRIGDRRPIPRIWPGRGGKATPFRQIARTVVARSEESCLRFAVQYSRKFAPGVSWQNMTNSSSWHLRPPARKHLRRSSSATSGHDHPWDLVGHFVPGPRTGAPPAATEDAPQRPDPQAPNRATKAHSHTLATARRGQYGWGCYRTRQGRTRTQAAGPTAPMCPDP